MRVWRHLEAFGLLSKRGTTIRGFSVSGFQCAGDPEPNPPQILRHEDPVSLQLGIWIHRELLQWAERGCYSPSGTNLFC